METAPRNRIKDFHFKTNKTSLYHLHSIKENTSDECKTLIKISTCKPLTTIPPDQRTFRA